MDIKTLHCLLFAYVFVVEATKQLKINIRYTLSARYIMSKRLFKNTSLEYITTKLAIKRMETESCTGIIIEAGNNNECSLNYATLLRIEPIFNQKDFRVVMQAEFRFSKDISFSRKDTGIQTDKISNLIKKTHIYYLPVSSRLQIIATHPLPVVCEREHDPKLCYSWPDSEAGVTHSVVFPSEKYQIIRFASRKCRSNGWDLVKLTTWTDHLLECKDVFLDGCLSITLKHLPEDPEDPEDNYEPEQVLNSIVSVFETHNLTTDVLEYVRNSIDKIVIQHSLSEGYFQFNNSNLAMRIHDIKELASAGSIAYFKISQPKGTGILSISLHTDGSNGHDIVIPVKSILNSVTNDTKSVDRVGLCVFKDAFLFQSSNNVLSWVYSIIIPDIENVTLKDEDNITFTFDVTKRGKYKRRCVFWDPKLNIGEGGWSEYGCRTFLKGDDLVECQCTHLSSFALMTIPQAAIQQRHVKRLNLISIIGCTISAVSLILTLITYLSFKSLIDDIPSKILVIICINLLCTNLLYILNVVVVYLDAQKSDETDEGSIACKSIAALFHYFLLASLAWMGANGYFMHKSLVDVFVLTDWIIWRLAVFASGLPLFIVIPTVVLHFNAYYGVVKEEICWLKDRAAIFLFIIPVALITTYNIYIFFFVLNQIRRISKTDANIKSIVSQFKGSLYITVSLGLTWGFAFMAVGWEDIIFAYLFVICNSFQGFVLFLIYCVFKEKTRNQWFKFYQRLKNVEILTSKTREISSTPAIGECTIAALGEELPISKLSTSNLKISKSTSIY